MKTLYARPSRQEHQVSHKVRAILREHEKLVGLDGTGAGSCITAHSYMWMFLQGAKFALMYDTPRDHDLFLRDLEHILGMIESNREVILEEK